MYAGSSRSNDGKYSICGHAGVPLRRSTLATILSISEARERAVGRAGLARMRAILTTVFPIPTSSVSHPPRICPDVPMVKSEEGHTRIEVHTRTHARSFVGTYSSKYYHMELLYYRQL